MKIPSDRIWSQLNQGEETGVLYTSQDIALDTIGKLRLSRRPVALQTSESNADFRLPVSIVYFDNEYTVVTDDRIFQGGLLGSAWSEVATFTPNTTDDSDAIVFNNRLVVTTNNNIEDWDGAFDDNSGLAALTSNVPHPMAIFDSLPTYKLAVGNGNQVKTYNTSYSPNPTVLTLASQFVVTSLKYRNGFLYIGTKTTDGSEARIFIWNGSGTNAQYECPVGCEWVYSMIEYGGSVAAVLSSGQLIQVSGSSPVELAAFPIFYQPHLRWQGTNSRPKVNKNGMTAVGDSIFINIEGELDNGYLDTMRSGLWVYHPQSGLSHHAHHSVDEIVSDNNLSVTDSIITTSADHHLKTGDAVEFFTVSGLVGVAVDTVYYATVVASNQIKLSRSRAGLMAGQYIQITGTAGTSDRLFYFPNTDSGYRFSRSAAIANTSINESTRESLTSDILFGCETQNSAGDTVHALNTFHDSSNGGLFVTQRINSDNIEQTWKAIYSFIDGLTNGNDKISVYIQLEESLKYTSHTGAWAETNVINSDSAFSATSDIKVGDTVFFTEGIAQGQRATITKKESSSSTISLTVDRAVGVAGSTSEFYVDNFRKLGEYTVNNKNNGYLKVPVVEKSASPWIKIMIEMQGVDMAVNVIDLENSKHSSQ